MSDTTRLTLDHPFKFDGSEIDHMDVRRPIVRDMLASDKAKGGDAEKEIALFANLTGQSPQCFQAMDLCDYRRLQEVYQSFLSSERKTLEEPA